MSQIFLVFLYLATGMLLKWAAFLPEKTPKYLNGYIIYIVLPAVALLYLPGIEWKAELILPAFSAWWVFLISWALFSILGKSFHWQNSTTGCLIITAGLSNTSFLGFPIIEALYGSEGLKIAFLIDQPGSFLIVSSLAVVVAGIYGDRQLRKRDIGRKILMFPPFIFFFIGLSMSLAEITFTGHAQEFLQLLGWTLSPVALLAVGMQVNLNVDELKEKKLWAGLAFSLLVAPLAVMGIIGPLLDFDGLIYQVMVMEAAMPSMITASIVAISYHLNPRLASLMVSLGILISAVTLTMWYWIL
ncbi:AEC family transporter [Litoribacter ruber]|uniref:AEC family transporter n=1 Tax=Litoribacter ruber TaxID=702568 RepID=UPI001BD9830B|nr:AEC family transporter [Litoribacter ruber]MBT0810308.1 AEC family transporter [Litoribacter ruber]